MSEERAQKILAEMAAGFINGGRELISEVYKDIAAIGTQPPTDPPVIVDPPIDPPVDPKPVGKIKMFDAIRWGGRASSFKGFTPCKFWYAAEFFKPVPKKGTRNYAAPKPGVIEAVARKAPKGLNVGDVEHMWFGNGQAMEPEAIQTFVDMTKRWQGAAGDGVDFSWYSGIPRNYHQANDPKTSSSYKNWFADVMKNRPILELCDAVNLSLYTFYEDRKGHELYMRRNIEAGKAVAGDLPVHVTLWPLYHDSSDRQYQQIEGDYWRMQLDVCMDAGVDGIVIWTRSDERDIPWSKIGDWWDETESFIAKNKIS